MDAKYINKNYLEDSIKDYDNTIIEPIRTVVNNIYYNTEDNFNNVNNSFNDVNNISNNKYKALISVIDMSISGGIGLNLQLNYINSTSPVNYQKAEKIIFTIGQIGNIWCDATDKPGTQYYDWNAATNTLTFSSLTSTITGNANMDYMFDSCNKAYFIGNILVPNNSTTMINTFHNCWHFNQNILIPNSVVNLSHTFDVCFHLNQNILIPNSVVNLSHTFDECFDLNQNILIPNSVVNLSYTFYGCKNLDQSDIYIYSQNISGIVNAFQGVSHIGNIHIPTSIPKDTSNFMYNCLVNGNAGYTFAPENIINDLPVDIAQWPPV